MSNKVGGMLCCCSSPNKYSRLDAKLEKKMVEVKRGYLGRSNFKSIDSIIMRFPQFREELKKIRDVFEQYGKFGQSGCTLCPDFQLSKMLLRRFTENSPS